MNWTTIAILLFGAVSGGFVSGLAGFGTALIALGIWLNVLPPGVAGTLVIICSVVSQTSALPTLWRSIDFKLVWPFLIGGLLGVPIGTLLVAHLDPRLFKLGVGVLLLVFPTILFFNKRPFASQVGGRAADGVIGFAGGILGGLAGLSGPPTILWASVRGWGKDERRGVFQTFNWTVLSASLCMHAASGLVTAEVIRLALIAFPGTLIGAWLGTRAYKRLSDRHFGDVVLGILFVSGAVLVWTSLSLKQLKIVG
jgi:uncharacterized membrane protein YfcA